MSPDNVLIMKDDGDQKVLICWFPLDCLWTNTDQKQNVEGISFFALIQRKQSAGLGKALKQ